jgi:RHS repeat-associated protein
VILTTTRQRNHDETALGSLGTPTTSPKSRVSYVADYFDAANRLTNEVNVGTNGGGAWTRPSSVPTGSDTVLVTTTAYTAAGFVDSVTDPRGIVAKNYYDALGRTTKTVQNYTGNPETTSSDVATEYTYDGDNNLLTLQADLPSSAYQQTKYIYGVSTAGGSGVNSNDILATVQHPDKSSGNPSSSEADSYTVNALDQVLTFTDRNGNVHTYTYDVLGRQTSDTITTLGSGVDGAVRRIDTAYDTQGNPYLVTSYSDTGGSTIVNQVQRAFNGLGQVITEYQAHSGAVNTSTTPSVQYAYGEMSGGANSSRLNTIAYPGGNILNYNYNTGLDSTISRLSSLSENSVTLESYSYLGVDTVVKRAHSQPGVDLTYIKQTGESTGDAGDQYTGLDRFGRVVDQRWLVTSTWTATDRFKYGYDRDGNPLYRDNLVNSAFGELYHASGSSNGYDNLNQLVAFARGTLNGSHDTISSPAHSITWSLDALGNFSSTTTDGGSAVNNTFNKQNKETAAGSNTLAFDSNGNLTTDDQGHTLVYDAWNRLVAVKNGSTTLVSYKYDGFGRRITETAGGNTRDLYYSVNWQVLEERYNGGTSADIQYVWSPAYVDALILRDRSTAHNGILDERLWVQQDANWNVTALINGSGTVVERYVYDPFGRVSFLTASWGTLSASAYAWIYLHQGSRWDSTSGLYDRRGRVYSPTLGRWLQVDPIGFAAGDRDLYRFVANSPIGDTDPSGLDPQFNIHTQAEMDQLEALYGPGMHPRKPEGDWEREWYDWVTFGIAPLVRCVREYDRKINLQWQFDELARKRVEMTDPIKLTDPRNNWRNAQGDITIGSSRAATFDPAWNNNIQIAQEQIDVLANFAAEWTARAGFDFVVPGMNLDIWGCLTACFAAGTPLLTPTGSKPIETFKPGDLILSAPENDPDAVPEARVVEETFTNYSTLLNVHIGGQVIRTTEEHPFYVRDTGWVSAKELQVGALLRSHDGVWHAVEAVTYSGEVAPVYNLRVADHHTYFVGGHDWGFSVWAHNTCVYTSIDPVTGKVNYVGITNNPVARFAAHRRAGLGVSPTGVPGLGSLTRAEARAVEQVLIEHFGLGKTGGSLLNKINSISSTNPIYASAKAIGNNMLHNLGLFGF